MSLRGVFLFSKSLWLLWASLFESDRQKWGSIKMSHFFGLVLRAAHFTGQLENGGKDNGAPGICGKGVYGAYLLYPDGNNIEA